MQLNRQSPSFEQEDRLSVIVEHLAKLGIRRQAKLDAADYLVLAEDLEKFDLRDIGGGLADIAKIPRREGETAFPEIGRMKQAIVERKLDREADEIRQMECEQWEALKEQCERERLEDIGKPRTEQEKRLDAMLAAAKVGRR